VSGRLHARQQLEKIMNQMVIVKVFGDRTMMKRWTRNVLEAVSKENDRENLGGGFKRK